MIIELSQVMETEVYDSTGRKLAKADRAIFNGVQAKLIGFQVILPGLVKKFATLNFGDVLSLDRREIVIDTAKSLEKEFKSYDELIKSFGRVVGVTAKTESGRHLGKVQDLYLDSESGFIIRFYLRNLLKERLIPREFLVSVSPKEIIFKDVVDQPIFDKIASSEVATAKP